MPALPVCYALAHAHACSCSKDGKHVLINTAGSQSLHLLAI